MVFPLRYRIGLFAALICGPSPAMADSRLPPSDPGAAIRLGALDQVRPSPLLPWQLLPCLGYDVVINRDIRHINTQYFHFSLSHSKSRLRVKMFETPDATLWFHLLSSQLGFKREYKGGDDQELVEDNLEPGEYYLKIVTDGTVQRLPDGTNRARVIFRAEPEGYRRAFETSPTDLGNLQRGESRTRNGSVAIRYGRSINFAPTPASRHCPLSAGVESDMYNEYVMRPPEGRIAVNVTTISAQNWPTEYPFKVVYLQRGNFGDVWREIPGGFVQHSGGELRIRVGYPSVSNAPLILARDAYVDYRLSVSASSAAPQAPQTPGQPQVIDLGPPLRSNEVIIGPIPR